jgi:hypothetical protein
MSKRRRKPRPYPSAPNAFVRSLTRIGWHRCDAEGIDAVRAALQEVGRTRDLTPAALRAAQALQRGPVLAGASRLLVHDPRAVFRVITLIGSLPPAERSGGLVRLCGAAVDAECLRTLRLYRAALAESEADDRDDVDDFGGRDDRSGTDGVVGLTA